MGRTTESIATVLKQALDENHAYPSPLATKITLAATFWPAEEYQQCYLKKKGLGRCH